MDIARNVPGLPGLFIVGALSAALSSMSSCLNALSGTVFEDFLKPYLPNASEKQSSNIMKFITFTLGMLFEIAKQIAACRYEKQIFNFHPFFHIFARLRMLWDGVHRRKTRQCVFNWNRFLRYHEWNSFGFIHHGNDIRKIQYKRSTRRFHCINVRRWCDCNRRSNLDFQWRTQIWKSSIQRWRVRESIE